MDGLPCDPLPAKFSQGSPMWRLRISGERMVLRGRTFGMHVAWGLLSVPVVYWICGRFGADRGLQFGLTLFPIFYAGGMAVVCLVTMAAIPRIESGIIVTMLFAAFGLVIARQPQWPRWNDPLWIGLLIPTV